MDVPQSEIGVERGTTVRRRYLGRVCLLAHDKERPDVHEQPRLLILCISNKAKRVGREIFISRRQGGTAHENLTAFGSPF